VGGRKTQEQLGYQNLKKAKTANLDKWGTDANHNILYVTGYSGSGKSTIAKSLANSKTNVIHLDTYFWKFDKNVTSKFHDKEFNKFLEQQFPVYKEIANADNHSKEKWKKVDMFMEQTEKFAAQQFKNGKKVIVEGVQLHDTTTYPDKNFFKGKPIVIVGSSAVVSVLRAAKRDERSLLMSPKMTKEFVEWYTDTHKNLSTLSDIVSAERGSE